MRVLALTNWYPPHHFGGYELLCFDAMRRFEAGGHEVTVLCSSHRRPEVADDDADARHERHVLRRLELWIEDDVLLRPSLRDQLRLERHNQRALAETLDRGAFDVVSVWHMGAMSVGLLTTIAERGIPMVYAICDDWLTYVLAQDRWAAAFSGSQWRRALGRAVRPLVGVPTTPADLASTGAFCFISELTRQRARALSPWSLPISDVVYAGIQRADFPPRPAEDRPWEGRLLYVGRFDPRKGIETLVRGLALLPSAFSLDICGLGGPAERKRLEALVRSLGIAHRVRFGSAPREELGARYAAADVFVFPSEWEEPFGLVPLEAMACGTPVVATGVGGSGEFLADGVNCVLFEAGDPGSLAGAVRRLADDPALRRRLVAGGERTARELDVDNMSDALEQWHLAAVDGFEWWPPPRRLEH